MTTFRFPHRDTQYSVFEDVFSTEHHGTNVLQVFGRSQTGKTLITLHALESMQIPYSYVNLTAPQVGTPAALLEAIRADMTAAVQHNSKFVQEKNRLNNLFGQKSNHKSNQYINPYNFSNSFDLSVISTGSQFVVVLDNIDILLEGLYRNLQEDSSNKPLSTQTTTKPGDTTPDTAASTSTTSTTSTTNTSTTDPTTTTTTPTDQSAASATTSALAQSSDIDTIIPLIFNFFQILGINGTLVLITQRLVSQIQSFALDKILGTSLQYIQFLPYTPQQRYDLILSPTIKPTQFTIPGHIFRPIQDYLDDTNMGNSKLLFSSIFQLIEKNERKMDISGQNSSTQIQNIPNFGLLSHNISVTFNIPILITTIFHKLQTLQPHLTTLLNEINVPNNHPTLTISSEDFRSNPLISIFNTLLASPFSHQSNNPCQSTCTTNFIPSSTATQFSSSFKPQIDQLFTPYQTHSQPTQTFHHNNPPNTSLKITPTSSLRSKSDITAPPNTITVPILQIIPLHHCLSIIRDEATSTGSSHLTATSLYLQAYFRLVLAVFYTLVQSVVYTILHIYFSQITPHDMKLWLGKKQLSLMDGFEQIGTSGGSSVGGSGSNGEGVPTNPKRSLLSSFEQMASQESSLFSADSEQSDDGSIEFRNKRGRGNNQKFGKLKTIAPVRNYKPIVNSLQNDFTSNQFVSASAFTIPDMDSFLYSLECDEYDHVDDNFASFDPNFKHFKSDLGQNISALVEPEFEANFTTSFGRKFENLNQKFQPIDSNNKKKNSAMLAHNSELTLSSSTQTKCESFCIHTILDFSLSLYLQNSQKHSTNSHNFQNNKIDLNQNVEKLPNHTTYSPFIHHYLSPLYAPMYVTPPSFVSTRGEGLENGSNMLDDLIDGGDSLEQSNDSNQESLLLKVQKTTENVQLLAKVPELEPVLISFVSKFYNHLSPPSLSSSSPSSSSSQVRLIDTITTNPNFLSHFPKQQNSIILTHFNNPKLLTTLSQFTTPISAPNISLSNYLSTFHYAMLISIFLASHIPIGADSRAFEIYQDDDVSKSKKIRKRHGLANVKEFNFDLISPTHAKYGSRDRIFEILRYVLLNSTQLSSYGQLFSNLEIFTKLTQRSNNNLFQISSMKSNPKNDPNSHVQILTRFYKWSNIEKIYAILGELLSLQLVQHTSSHFSGIPHAVSVPLSIDGFKSLSRPRDVLQMSSTLGFNIIHLLPWMLDRS